MKMKKQLTIAAVLAVIALVAVIGFTACDNGTTSGGRDPGVQRPTIPLKETYVNYDTDGNKYELVITEATGRALVIGKNYIYTLTITFVNGTKAISTGIVAEIKTIEDDEGNVTIESIDLKHTGTGTTITVTVSGSDGSQVNKPGDFAIKSVTDEDNKPTDAIPVDSDSDVKDVPIPTTSYKFNDVIDPDNGAGIGYILIKGEVLPDGTAAPIPERLADDKPVIGIGWTAFANNKDLRSIEIPAHITHIAWWANFENCTNLTTVTFAAGSKLEYIGGGAFMDCTSLTSITIPASVTTIEGWLNFARCTNLKTVTFETGSKLQTIGGHAFLECTSLESITIPASVTTIKNWGTFQRCTNLKTVTFAPGSQLKTITGGATFDDCTSLTSIEIPASVTLIEYWGTFSGCTNLKTITFAPGSQLKAIIGGGTFLNCTSLENITIPASVTTIEGWGNFAHCTNLKTVTFESGSKLQTIDEAAFIGCTSLSAITIPASVTFIDSWAFEDCTSIESITIPEGVSIGYRVFNRWTSSQTINVRGYASPAAANAAWGDWLGDCDAVIKYWNGSAFVEPGLEYELVDDVDSIGYGGYRVISGPRRGVVNIPATYNGKPVTFISNGAFEGTGITDIIFAPGSQLETIGYAAFARCYNLTSITIPASVMWIDISFPGCKNLKTITVDAGNPNYTSEGGILYNKDKTVLEEYPSASGNVTIPPGVTIIGSGAFREGDLTGITIPAEVESILWHAFIGCTGINSITIPATVTYMSDVLFEAWTSTQTINIEGHANRASTIATGWSDIWDKNCDAKIIYGQ